MKTSARFLAMLLAVVMIAGAALSVSAFSDVTGAVEHATAINVLAQLGVIGGYGDGTFKPDQNVTRAEMAKLVYVLYTTFTDAGAGAVKFDDVKADHWATGYISWCASKNIIGGYGDGNFGPNDNVTYDQALKMVAGTLGYNEWDSNQWPTDVRMKALNELKLGTDMPETVKGGDKLTRAQVAQIMYNALEANMKETKSVTEYFPGTNIPISLPVAKTLAEDVWKFGKVDYTITAFETKDNKTTLTLTWEEDKTDKDGNVEKDEDGKVIKVTKKDTFKLAELGLEAYEGKAEDLVNLHLVGLVKNDEMLGVPSLLGTIVNDVKVSFKTTKKNITIDGKEYDEDDFAEDAKHTFAIFVDGKEVEEVFVKNAKGAMELADKITKALNPNKQYLARTIDFEGDGYIDVLEIVPKIGYVVTEVKTTKGITKVTLDQLDGKGSLVIADAANLSIEVEEEDIVVAAKLGATVFAEKVEGKTAYATKLSADKATLNEIGAVEIKNTLTGVNNVEVTNKMLGKDETRVYYIYNGEIIKIEGESTKTDYAFAILRDVEQKDDTFNPATQEIIEAYYANLLVVENGALTLKTLLLDPADGENLIKEYERDSFKNDNGTFAKYTYALVTGYKENKDGYYELTIDKAVDSKDEDYIIVEAGKMLAYNADTEYYEIDGNKKIRANEDSVFFYTTEVEDGRNKGFVDVKYYTKETITKNPFDDAQTTGVTVLYKNANDRLYLLATFVNGEIEGSAEESVVSYKNDGSLVLFAPESSSREIVEDKIYNSYIFMDNATLTVKDAELDTENEYDKDTNKGTVAGGLYGYDAKNGTYVQINKDNIPESVKATTLLDVIADDEIIEFANGDTTTTKKVAADVTIWGLAKAEKNDEFAKLSLEDLEEMYKMVDKYNEDATDKLAIRAIILSKVDKTIVNNETVNKETIKTIIVEIFEADEEDDDLVYSVNDEIFDVFYGIED